MQTPPLRVLFLRDDKPGHYLRTEGVIAALRKLRCVEVERLSIRRRSYLASQVLQRATNLGVPPDLVLKWGYGINPRNLPQANVVISAGGDTLAANAAAASLLGAPNIFYGRLRRLDPGRVSVVIVPYEKYASLPNHVLALPPSAFEPSSRAGRSGRLNPPALVGVMVGGDSGTVRYRPNDWERLVDFLRRAHEAHGIKWAVTTSRRSSALIVDALTQLAEEGGHGIERFIPYGRGSADTVPDILAASDAVLVTDDSTSMVAEAIAACQPVVGVKPKLCAHEQEEEEFRDFVSGRGWYRTIGLARLTPDSFLDALDEIKPRTTSANDELASVLKLRLPGLFPSQ